MPKNVVNLFSETRMLGAKPVGTRMNLNVKLSSHEGKLIENTGQHIRLVSELIYITYPT